MTVRRIVQWYRLGHPPEDITERIGHRSLAQVHAALADFHANREAIDVDLKEEATAADALARQHAVREPGTGPRFRYSISEARAMSEETLKQDIVRDLDRLSAERLREVKAFIGGLEQTHAEESSSALLEAAGCLSGEPLSAEDIEEALYPTRDRDG